MKTLLVFTALMLSACTGFAAAPEIDRFTPHGAKRGSEVDVIFSGPRLGDARGLLFYEPGISTKSVEVLPDKRVKARLAIAADCTLGAHAMRMQTATGISKLFLFSVGALSEVDEIEPNNDFSKPQKINLNSTVNGVVLNEDVDYFAVEAKKGQRLSAEVEGLRLGEIFFDPSMAIMDTNRFVLAAADDTPLMKQDCAGSVIVPRDGTYIVQVRESAFGGNDRCNYRLHVGTFPRPLAVYPAGGKFGESLEVTFIGDSSGPIKQKVTLPSTPQRDFALWAQDSGGIAPSPNPFRLSTLDNVMEKEPNDDPGHATPFTAPAALNGVIEKPGDHDFWVFPAKKGQAFDVRVFARQLRTPLDSVIHVTRSSNGQYITGNDDSDGPDSYVRFTAPEDDRYVIQITDQMNRGGPEFVYRIEVTPVQPRLVLGLPERSQFIDILAPVPKGNRFAVLLNAQREDFGGDVNLELNGLPGKVTPQILPMSGDQSVIPVLLTAAADAQPSAALVEVLGKHKEGDRTIEGRLTQRSQLVRGDNNREVINYYSNRLATAVTEAAPFHVDIVQPKVPLVQNGNMELKIAVTRDKGFKGAVAIRMLYSPPGVSVPESIQIPDGQNQGTIQLTADGGASIRKWKIAVLAEAYVGDGPVTVSSQLADLEVAEPVLRFQFQPATVEQGQKTSVVVKVDKTRKFDSPASIELLGLPNEVTTEVKQINDAGEVVFPINSTAKSPVGLHKTLICRAVVKSEGEPITHIVGGGELRIQAPLPPKTTVAAKPAPKPAALAPAKPAAPRPLSRLEQLRAEKKGQN